MTILVQHIQQPQGSNYCFAACCAMFVARYGVGVETIQGFAHQRHTKFGNGLNVQSDYIEVNWILKSKGYQTERVEGPMSYAQLRAILDNARLIIAFRGGHAWLIVGVEITWGGVPWIWVRNPTNPAGPDRRVLSEFSDNWMNSVVLSQRDVNALD